MPISFITGVCGQDGSLLAEFLLDRGHVVHGMKRRSSSFNTQRVDHLYENKNFQLHYGDLTDSLNVIRLISDIKPDYIFNLGAMSHVAVSFEEPEYTANCDGLGVLRLLEAIKILGLEKRTKLYQASTSEMLGGIPGTEPQNEFTKFQPQSPYACAKLFAHHLIGIYRQMGIWCCAGILFNHEGERRGPTFVTKKITRSVARISCGLQKSFSLGNLNALRDWGNALDYVEAMWLMVQQSEPKDFIISTGQQHSVREFVEQSFKRVNIEIVWQGSGLDEIGINKITGQTIVTVDPKYFRPLEVESLLGDSSLARQELNWQPKISFDQLVDEMIERDLRDAKQEVYLKKEINV